MHGGEPAAIDLADNRLVQRALELDENDAECHRITCRVSLTRRQFDKSESHLRRALELTPNDPRLIVQRGINSTFLGDVETALPWIEQAMRIDPFSASRYETDLVRALYAARRVDKAVDVLEGSTRTHYDTNCGVRPVMSRSGAKRKLESQ